MCFPISSLHLQATLPASQLVSSAWTRFSLNMSGTLAEWFDVGLNFHRRFPKTGLCLSKAQTPLWRALMPSTRHPVNGLRAESSDIVLRMSDDGFPELSLITFLREIGRMEQ